ncbi:alpha/beta fold hydrolase [Aliihoeflea sp. PC F10.4]
MWNVDQTANTSKGEVAWGRAGEGPALVLAHGWPWSSYSWHRVIEALGRSFTVHWYDMPGYGASSKDADRSTALDAQGELLVEMIDLWQLDAPSVVAHDVGGAVALRAHLLHDANFERLVLMNVVALSPWGSDFFDLVSANTDVFARLPVHIHRAVVGAYIKGALVNELEGEDFERLCAPWLDDAGRRSFYAQFAQADERLTDEFEDRLNDIRCPVAILWGEDDPWIPVSRGRELHDRIERSTFRQMKGLGHLPQLENPQYVADELLAALDVTH